MAKTISDIFHLAPVSDRPGSSARRVGGPCTSLRWQLIIDYLIAHPECKVREVMDACGVSKVYVYQIKKMLEG